MSEGAYAKLLELYRRCPTRSLSRDLEYFLARGHVFASQGAVLIGQDIGGRGWHIHVAIGVDCFKKFCDWMPYWLPHIGWAREQRGRSEIRWHETETIMRKVGYTYDQIEKFRADRTVGAVSFWRRGKYSSATSSATGALEGFRG